MDNIGRNEGARPEGHLVYFVSDVVDQLDLSAIRAVYEVG